MAPEMIVAGQLAAYNARDVDRFVACRLIVTTFAIPAKSPTQALTGS
jgi:hypothetical protein